MIEETCQKCLGSCYFSDCFDDMCHGQEECIHGDDSTCSDCDGEGVRYWPDEDDDAPAERPHAG